jgi:hypothetical protein
MIDDPATHEAFKLRRRSVLKLMLVAGVGWRCTRPRAGGASSHLRDSGHQQFETPGRQHGRRRGPPPGRAHAPPHA